MLYKADTEEEQPDRWRGMATNALQISIEGQKPPRVRDGRPDAMSTTTRGLGGCGRENLRKKDGRSHRKCRSCTQYI